MLAQLDTRQQALIMGQAVPMPAVIRTRTCGTSAFHAEMGAQEMDALEAVPARGRAILIGEGSQA